MNFFKNEPDILNSGRLLRSSEIMNLLQIKSQTTLIKLEREGQIKIARRIGNQKRYNPKDIRKVMGL